MGSLFGRQKTVAPPEPVYNTYRDEVNKVEQVPVKQADGTVVYVTRPIALTPAEQAEKAKLERIKNEALAEVQRLSKVGADDPESVKAADEYVARQTKVLDDVVADRTRGEEVVLARRGLADSAAALAARRKRRLDEQDAKVSLQDSRSELLNQIRGQKLTLQQNLFNIANSNLKGDAAVQYQAATNALSRSIAADTSRQASILSYYGRSGGGGGGSFDNAFGKSLGTAVGTGVGGAVGGPAGAAIGGAIGGALFSG